MHLCYKQGTMELQSVGTMQMIKLLCCKIAVKLPPSGLCNRNIKKIKYTYVGLCDQLLVLEWHFDF